MASTSGKPPPKRYPFPRDITRPITGPALEAHDSVEDARAKWHAYLRLLSTVRKMDLPTKVGKDKH